MKPVHHVAISAVISYGFFSMTQSFIASVLCFLSGIFIDLDHHLDCYLGRGKFPFKYSELVDFCKNDHHAKLYIFFHSYELIFLLWIGVSYFELGVVWVGILLGVTIHILCDDLVNPLKPISYFFFYRLFHRFDRRALLKEGTIDGKK